MEYVVLQEPNKVNDYYYIWRESDYTKIPKYGFYGEVQANIHCDKLNSEKPHK